MKHVIFTLGLACSLGLSAGAEPMQSRLPASQAPTVAPAVNDWFRQNTGVNIEDFFRSSVWALNASQKEALSLIFKDLTRQSVDSRNPQLLLEEAWPRIWDVLSDEQRDRVALFLDVRDGLANSDLAAKGENMSRQFSDVAQKALVQLRGQMGNQDPLVTEIFEAVLRKIQSARP